MAFAAKLRCHHQSVGVAGRVNVLIRLDYLYYPLGEMACSHGSGERVSHCFAVLTG